MAKSKKKQKELSGFERPVNEKLDEAVERLKLTKKERLKLLGLVRIATGDVATELKAAGLESYTYVDGEARWTVKLTPGHEGVSLKAEKLKDQEVQIAA